MSGKGQFEIRPHRPARHIAVLRLAMVGIALFGLYVVFEFGRYSVGFNRVAESERLGRLQQQLQDLQRDNHDLRQQLASFDTERAGAAREREEVGSVITQLQAQIDRDRQDLAVYRGVVSPASQGSAVQVEQLRITGGDAPLQYRVHLTLMQSGRPDAVITGNVLVHVLGDGPSGSAPVLVTLATVVPAPVATGRQVATEGTAFSFRYYQALEYAVQLPPGLRPQRLEVELRPVHPAAPAVTQSFPWKIDPT